MYATRGTTLLLTALMVTALPSCGAPPPGEAAHSQVAYRISKARSEHSAPLHYQIAALESARAEYARLSERGSWPNFPAGASLRAGMTDPRVPALRSILLQTGDYSGSVSSPDSNVYDEALAAAVARFQERHALPNDGVVGKTTQAALAVPPEKRLAAIDATLTRLRETPQEGMHGRYILVNLAAYRLQAVEDDRVVLTSRVINGRADRRTPLISRPVESVVFNPAWNVPHRIASQDILRKVKKNPSYLQNAGFTLTSTSGGEREVVNPESVDWSQMEASDFNYGLRQRPGAGNALGKIKFHLPNSNAIYLHSTSDPQLFEKPMRNLSSGCVRVEKAQELAYFVLYGTDKWDRERIDRAYDGNKSMHVGVKQPPSVQMVYWPVWADDDGRINFYPDVYRLLRS